MKIRIKDAILFMFRLMDITIIDADPSSRIAFELLNQKIKEGGTVLTELTKAREGWLGCVIIHIESGLDFLKSAASNRDKGGERCSRSLQLS